MYEHSVIIENKCSVKILLLDIKCEFIKMLSNLYRSKVDRFSHYYLHINCQYCKNVVI